MAGKKILIERVFDAPVSKVWRAWTEPEHIKRWWGPAGFTSPDARIDFRVGGKYVYCMRGAVTPGGPEQDYYSGGVFLEIIPEKLIVQTDYFSDADGNKVDPADYFSQENDEVDPELFGMADMPKEMQITVTFVEYEGKTRLTLDYQELIPEAHYYNMSQGWEQSLDKLAQAIKEA